MIWDQRTFRASQMNNSKINIRTVIPTVTIAFITGYFFKWLVAEHLLSSADMTIWLGAFGTIAAIVGAFVLGERQIHALWRNAFEVGEQCAGKKRAALLAMATAAFHAIDRLDNQYRNTHEDRMRIRTVYHGDTFASLIEALMSIPVHELPTVEAAVALAGLKKNMIDAHKSLERFVAAKNKTNGGDVLFPDAVASLDLRGCKTHAELHYRALEKALKCEDPRKSRTKLAPVGPFWTADPGHRDYLEHYPIGYICHFIHPN